MMRHFKIIIALVLLVSSIIVFITAFFITQPVQIILETGQEVVTQSPNFFSLAKTLMLVVCAFFIGGSVTYLFYNSNAASIATIFRKPEESQGPNHPGENLIQKFETVLPLLKHDERKVIKVLLDNKGEMLQNALVLETGLSKVKITRELSSLEGKSLIVRERFGLTNKIKLVK
jgi:hypothetical protein